MDAPVYLHLIILERDFSKHFQKLILLKVNAPAIKVNGMRVDMSFVGWCAVDECDGHVS